MSVNRIICHVDPATVPELGTPTDIHVLLYGSTPVRPGTAIAGGQIPDLASRFGLVIRDAAFDFVSVALAVTAADTFVKRESGEDAWARTFEVELPLSDVAPWERVRERLEAALHFLSGDIWTFRFAPGGRRAPASDDVRRRTRVVPLDQVDCACLFSGGLDSAIGALRLIGDQRRPLLVSHVYRGDKTYQEDVASRLPRSVPSIHANFYPTWDGPDDDTMRTRSVSFLALGVLAATAISQFRGDRIIDLVIAENGFIALNAPLTPRRVGTLSTRTAHPHFLGEMQTILDAVGLPVRIENTCRHQTKGEMLRGSIHEPDFAKLAVATVSCGKWKRRNIQCGRCVPCLVRRAAFHAAALPDTTPYEWANLPDVLIDEDGRDDVVAAMTAVRRLHRRGAVAPWVLQAGPLPEDPSDRLAYVDVFRRGILELQSFLKASGLP